MVGPPASARPGHAAASDGGGARRVPGGVVPPDIGDRGPDGLVAGGEPGRLRRVLLWSFPGPAGLVLVLAGSILAGDWLKQRREASRALPPSDAPNVLLIVLDTVRRDRLSLYGYGRPTTPNLERLARRGIRFDGARAHARNLASHASLFTGRRPRRAWRGMDNAHPEQVHHPGRVSGHPRLRDCRVRSERPVLFLRHRPEPRIHVLRRLRPGKAEPPTHASIEELLRTVVVVVRDEAGLMHSAKEFLTRWFEFGVRGEAAAVNRGFLGWLDRRREPGRPFFAFLNYLDARHAGEPGSPRGGLNFGRKPGRTIAELWIINDMWASGDKLALPRPIWTWHATATTTVSHTWTALGGELFDDWSRRGLLDRTWVLITSDHGERGWESTISSCTARASMPRRSAYRS